MIGPEDIRAAAARIAPHLRATPVLRLEAGALCDGYPVALKLEHHQHTGSFKVRGGLNAILSGKVGPAGVVAFSGGNHGAAVAYAATRLGHKSKVFAPAFAGPLKIARMRGFGAEVEVMDTPVNDILAAFLAYAAETGALPVHPYDDALVLAGQGTVAQEIERDLPDLDTIFVSVGGGGLVGGVAAWYGRRIKIVAVETCGTATYASALRDGIGSAITPSGVAASALGASSMGVLPFALLAQSNVRSVLVEDADVIAAQARLWDSARIVGEPGAATALAALTSGAYKPAPGERLGVLVCGGNAGPGWFID